MIYNIARQGASSTVMVKSTHPLRALKTLFQVAGRKLNIDGMMVDSPTWRRSDSSHCEAVTVVKCTRRKGSNWAHLRNGEIYCIFESSKKSVTTPDS